MALVRARDSLPDDVVGRPTVGGTRTTSQSTARWSGLLRWKCDVHAWMSGFVGVSRNPYFAVSDAAGAFRIENLPPGHYSLAAWHEKFGEKEFEVSVEPGHVAKVVIRFGQKSEVSIN